MTNAEILVTGALLFHVVWFACKWFYRTRDHKMQLEYEHARCTLGNSHMAFIHKLHEGDEQ